MHFSIAETLVKHQSGLKIDLLSLQRGNNISRLRKVKNVMKDDLILKVWGKLNGQENGYTRRQFLEEIVSILNDPIGTALAQQ